jgi:hypothetical protein
MVKLIRIAPIIAAAFSACLFAQQPADQDISGTWVQSSNKAIKWTFVQKDGAMHIQQMNGGKVIVDFTCTLNGKECETKEDGRSEKIMLYYNGPKLVVIKERGNDALKQRIALSSDGKTFQLETVPLSESQKSETMTFQRQSAPNTNNKS